MSHDDWCTDENCGHKRREPKPVKHTTRGFLTEWVIKNDDRRYWDWNWTYYRHQMPWLATITLNVEVDAEQADMLAKMFDAHLKTFDTQALLDALSDKNT